MWHVSSLSGVAALRTAIHLLLTYLLTFQFGLQIERKKYWYNTRYSFATWVCT